MSSRESSTRLSACFSEHFRVAFRLSQNFNVARFQALLGQAIAPQHAVCRLHNGLFPADPAAEPSALLVDHACPASSFPSPLRHSATEHCDVVASLNVTRWI